MIVSNADFPSGPARSRRSRRRVIVLAVCAVFGLIVIGCCCAVTLAVMVVLRVLGAFVESFGYIAGITWFVIEIIPRIGELLWLLSTGQIIPFAVKVLRMLGPS